MHGFAGAGKKFQHLLVQLLERVARVHHQHQPDKLGTGLQVAAKQLYPMRAHGFGHLGIAVAGQIHHIVPISQAEEVDMLGTAWSFGNISQAGVGGERIDSAGFAGITAPHEGDFGRGIGQVF